MEGVAHNISTLCFPVAYPRGCSNKKKAHAHVRARAKVNMCMKKLLPNTISLVLCISHLENSKIEKHAHVLHEEKCSRVCVCVCSFMQF